MPAIEPWGPDKLTAKSNQGALILFLFILFTLLPVILLEPVQASAEPCASILLEVFPDGSVAVNETLNITEAPANISVRLLGTPLYIYALDDSGVPLPLTYNATHAVITVYSTGLVYLYYYTMNLTSKIGETWSLSLESSCPTIILLPDNSIPVSVNPTPTPVIVGNRTGLSFPSGATITLNYYLIPTQFFQGTQRTTTLASPPVSPSGENNKYLYILIIIIIVLGIALYAALSRKGRKNSPDEEVATSIRGEALDERDKKIIEALKKKPMSAQELIQETNIPKTPLYRRLNKMIEDGVIEFYEEGGVRIYRLKDSRDSDPRTSKQ